MTGLNRKRKENFVKHEKDEERLNHKKRSNQVGPDCGCKTHKCWQNTNAELRQNIFNRFNEIGSKNEQDTYLMTIITLFQPKRDTVRSAAKKRKASYSYKVRFEKVEVAVCLTAFCQIHGITKGRVRRIQDHILKNVDNPRDMRGKHTKNRYRQTPTEILNLVDSHINSFGINLSNYIPRGNPYCRYLTGDFSVSNMHKLFLKDYQIQVSYPVYRSVFKHKFNLKLEISKDEFDESKEFFVYEPQVNIMVSDEDEQSNNINNNRNMED